MSALEENNPSYKNCSSCGKTFFQRKDYEASTIYIGTFKTGKYSEYDLELRNCSCGTTLATHTDKTPSEETPPVKFENASSKNLNLKVPYPQGISISYEKKLAN